MKKENKNTSENKESFPFKEVGLGLLVFGGLYFAGNNYEKINSLQNKLEDCCKINYDSAYSNSDSLKSPIYETQDSLYDSASTTPIESEIAPTKNYKTPTPKAITTKSKEKSYEIKDSKKPKTLIQEKSLTKSLEEKLSLRIMEDTLVEIKTQKEDNLLREIYERGNWNWSGCYKATSISVHTPEKTTYLTTGDNFGQVLEGSFKEKTQESKENKDPCKRTKMPEYTTISVNEFLKLQNLPSKKELEKILK